MNELIELLENLGPNEELSFRSDGLSLQITRSTITGNNLHTIYVDLAAVSLPGALVYHLKDQLRQFQRT